MRIIKYLLLLITLITCNSDKKHYEDTMKNVVNDLYVELINENRNDTINNGDYYESRIYLNDTTLFGIARNNGISDYLLITYDINTDPYNYSRTINKKKATMVGDTGVIRFQVLIPDLKKDSIKPFYWQFEAYIKYYNPNAKYDVAYAEVGRIYIKGD